MRRGLLLGLAVIAITLCACGSGKTYGGACQGVSLAKSGQWDQSQQHWLLAETAAGNAGDMGATTAYAKLGTDAGTLAMDQLQNSTAADADLKIYNDDISSYQQYLSGC